MPEMLRRAFNYVKTVTAAHNHVRFESSMENMLPFVLGRVTVILVISGTHN